MIRAIVFDFDGVLANSEPLHFQAFRDVLADEGIDLSERDYYARYLGFDDAGSFEAIAADRGVTWSGADTARLIAKKAALMERLERDISVLFPGAADIIRAAAARMPIGIASGALGPEIRRVLDRERLTACFTAIVAAGDTPASKPAPDPYLRAVALLNEATSAGVQPHECAAVEDSRWGIESARNAGLWTVGVAQTYAPESLQNAHVIIKSIGEFDAVRLDELFRIRTPDRI